jgi:hypothetical protein
MERDGGVVVGIAHIGAEGVPRGDGGVVLVQ